MFRGRNTVDGRWVTQEFSDEEMEGFLKRVSEFNMKAFKQAVRDSIELRESDHIREEQQFHVVVALFDKLGLNTFSVVHNQAQNMKE
jgi:hypothetical protein